MVVKAMDKQNQMQRMIHLFLPTLPAVVVGAAAAIAAVAEVVLVVIAATTVTPATPATPVRTQAQPWCSQSLLWNQTTKNLWVMPHCVWKRAWILRLSLPLKLVKTVLILMLTALPSMETKLMMPETLKPSHTTEMKILLLPTMKIMQQLMLKPLPQMKMMVQLILAFLIPQKWMVVEPMMTVGMLSAKRVQKILGLLQLTTLPWKPPGKMVMQKSLRPLI
mmetsp:Transcript_30381/g.50483  ORF Transcript_30381/g.50483 Transcript_30381/m.50483 type:complete len:221 (-) Transcript_30381:3-665(-)